LNPVRRSGAPSVPGAPRAACRKAIAFLFVLLGTAGCELRRGALAPASAEALDIGRLFWVFFWLSWVIFALVTVATAVACWRARSSGGAEREEHPEDPLVERKLCRAVVASTATSVVILLGLLVASVASGRGLSDLGREAPVTIQVTAHQWWWEVKYPGPTVDQSFATANELHVPTGRNVRIVLQSADVIHSFWVPSLTGKRDLIPNRTTVVAFRVDGNGAYPGRCAEFCGVEHARMDLTVVAESPAAFERWRASQRAPAAPPSTPEATHGEAVFMSNTCVSCHRIAGTAALATVGPELTHLASRGSLAAGALPRTRRSTVDWVRDPQRFKPGAHMPATPLSDTDAAALADYLDSLR
jgi:cytochrome c oxidase subunit 2